MMKAGMIRYFSKTIRLVWAVSVFLIPNFRELRIRDVVLKRVRAGEENRTVLTSV